MEALWIIVIIVALILLTLVILYNKLVKLTVRSEEAWSDIDVQLKRRYDLIPNLVETVKGYAKHEKKVFQDVTEARTAAMGAKSISSKSKAENQIESALKSIFAVAENYPSLQASKNFSQLQSDLTDTEDKIQASRRFYNANVRELNIAVQTFPTNIIANIFKFNKKDLFELKEEAAKKPVEVNFDDKK